jgi:hypothetical protein
VRHHSALPVVVFAFAAFAVLSTATVGMIFLYFARRPGEAEAHLSDLRDRVVRAGPAIFAIVSAAVSVLLVVDGVIGIVGKLGASARAYQRSGLTRRGPGPHAIPSPSSFIPAG